MSWVSKAEGSTKKIPDSSVPKNMKFLLFSRAIQPRMYLDIANHAILHFLSELYVPFSRETHSPAAFHGQHTEVLQKDVTVQTSSASERVGGGYSALHPLALLVFRSREPRRVAPR